MLPFSVRTTTFTSFIWRSEKHKVFRDHILRTSLTMMLHRLHRTLSDLKVVGNLSDFSRNHILASEFLIPCHLDLPPWNLKGKPLNLKTKTTQNSYFYFLASFGTEHNFLNIWKYFYKTIHFLMHALVHWPFPTCSITTDKYSQKGKSFRRYLLKSIICYFFILRIILQV